MNDLLLFAAQNTLAAGVLALLVYCVTRVWRCPPVAHVLWVLVLLKLVCPPIVGIESPAPSFFEWLYSGNGASQTTPPVWARLSKSGALIFPSQPDGANAPKSFALANAHGSADAFPSFPVWPAAVLFWLWLAGAAVVGLVAAFRIVRFEREIRGMLPASERLQKQAREIAERMGVRSPPNICCAASIAVPMVWRRGRRATVLLPMGMLQQFDDRQVGMILAHELAHLRRGDPWVRGAELFVTTLYWWNPLVWMVRKQIHAAEDQCCDAWVRWAFPGGEKEYAEVVFKAAEGLNAGQVRPRLLPASPFLRSLTVKARIAMILESRFSPRVSTRSKLGVAVIALLVLPAFVQFARTAARAEEKDKAEEGAAAQTPAKADVVGKIRWVDKNHIERWLPGPTSSEFPHDVKFEQGPTRFENGDKITITEVRGTAETFTPGHIYWIKGTYTLASHDAAALCAFTTAMDAADGRSSTFAVQKTTIKKGSGEFTLFLPMTYRGWPQVSFYPADGGEGFGGNYFGTGDSVLKRWWDEKAVAPTANGNAAESIERGKALVWLLGLELAAILKDDAEFAEPFRYNGGLRVNAVAPNSPATSAGLRQGDVIVGLGKYEICSLSEFGAAVKKADPQLAKLYVWRHGKTFVGELQTKLEH